MSEYDSPKIPQYRMTLFYGPEKVEHDSDAIYCVFNVKKRSWKAGVQVVVEIAQAQLLHIRNLYDFEQWLKNALEHLSESERVDYIERGQDIFVQQICLFKLHLAIEAGIHQENSRISKNFLVTELDKILDCEKALIKEEILQELDIDPLHLQDTERLVK